VRGTTGTLREAHFLCVRILRWQATGKRAAVTPTSYPSHTRHHGVEKGPHDGDCAPSYLFGAMACFYGSFSLIVNVDTFQGGTHHHSCPALPPFVFAVPRMWTTS